MSEISRPDMTYQWSSSGVMVTPSSTKVQTGWAAEVPPYQWENYIQNRQDNAIVHLFQKGISVWSATQDYYFTTSGTKAFVQGSDGKVYEAVQSSTNQNPVTDSTNAYWRLAFRDQSGSALYALDTGTANVYQASYTPVVKTLVDGMVLKFKSLNANTSTATFTPANGVIAAAPIVGGSHSALQGGEVTTNGDVWVQWNTSIGGGSWVLIDSTGGALQVGAATKGKHAIQLAQMVGVVGGSLNVKTSVSVASSTATFTADEVAVKSTLGGIPWLINNLSATVNLATTGAGGMDTGSAPVSGYVAVYAIFNPTTSSALLLATNATSTAATEVYTGANMPSGYTASALISVLATNSSSQFAPCFQRGRKVSFPTINVLTSVLNQASFAALSLAGAVPLNAISCSGTTQGASTTATLITTQLASNLSGWEPQQMNGNASTQVGVPFKDISLPTPQTIYRINIVGTGTPSWSINVVSYIF